jgi:hypothetical protein
MRNITRLKEFIGLANPEDAVKEHFSVDERRFEALAPWAAQSLIARYTGDNRGIGWRTSMMVKDIASLTERLMDRPFAAARQPTVWQSAITRGACADYVALMVAASMPAARRSETDILKNNAIEHAFMALCAGNHPPQSLRMFDKLAALAVSQMNDGPGGAREKWALAEGLPDFPRALALWSSPVLIGAHRTLADELFRRVARLPLSRFQMGEQCSRLFSLLDLAIASGAKAGRLDLIADVNTLWRETYPAWKGVADGWDDVPLKLAAALDKDGPERAWLLSDLAFAQSHCRGAVQPASEG